MRTVGVDLSAEARGTGIAVLDWDAGGVRLNGVQVGADDAMVLAALNDADRAAIDCPLGWPEPFIEFLIAHRAGRAPAPTGQSGLEWRHKLSRRVTDLYVAKTVPGCAPLAVGADRIAAVAMRAAGLVDEVRTALPNFDWSSHEPVCRRSDDALDAVVCALIPRAAHLGLTRGPPDH